MADDLEALRAENRQLRSLLRRIHTATKQFYVPKDMTPDNCPYEDILGLYHVVCTKLPKVRKLSCNRKKAMRKRWLDDLPTLNDWHNYFVDVACKEFMNGQNARGWRADIDWLLKEDSIVKTQEGKYD